MIPTRRQPRVPQRAAVVTGAAGGIGLAVASRALERASVITGTVLTFDPLTREHR